jgi:hypothetical protein
MGPQALAAAVPGTAARELVQRQGGDYRSHPTEI